ncbi:MAG: hypothetical protein ACM3VZ_11420 [Acidobacteriota bacterium]
MVKGFSELPAIEPRINEFGNVERRPNPMAKMNEDELKAITDGEMRQAVGYWSGKLASQRTKAMAYYLGEAKFDLSPSEVEGRSSVVSPDVRNTIESMLPQLMVKFVGGDKVVEFEATKPGDEPMAEQATDYINHIFFVKNPGERVAYNWMKDALLSKNGIVKVWWDTRHEEKREEYTGLDQFELAQLLDDEEIEITEQKSYPDEEDQEQRDQALSQLQQAAMQDPHAAQQIAQVQSQPPKMLWDVTCKRTKKGGKVCVENVPPEEFLINRKAKSIADATFVGHRVARTVSELNSMGYKNVDQISSDDQATSMNMERIERMQFDDEMAYMSTDTVQTMDDSQRVIWVTECYLRVDFDGDGIAELRKVVRAGNQILDNEVVDVAPFVSITPIPMPHKFFGLSVADVAMEGQKVNTMLLRGVLDNTYLQINGRYYAVDGQVNLDDLLTSRPGGVVRVKQAGAAGRLDQGAGDSQLGMGMLEYMKGFQEEATGWSRNSAGNSPDSLKNGITATQANIVTNKADMRVDLIARNFAEGWRDLFRLILKLCSQYQQKEDVVKLCGQWVAVNPREWRNGFDTVINVGLGTGSRDQQVQHLTMMGQMQAQGLQIGIATPANIYNTSKELTKALGFKGADRFWTDPSQNQQLQKPDPEQMKAQAQMQVEQMKAQVKAQSDQASREHELMIERERMNLQAQVDTHRQQVEAQQKALESQNEKELQQIKIQAQAELERFKAEMQQQTALMVAKINAEAQIMRAQLQASATPVEATSGMDQAADNALNADDQTN